MKKTILHITAGDDNWNPTEKELKSIADKFRRAIKAATPTHTPVVPTRSGVQVQIVEFDPVPYPYVTSGFAQVVTNQSNPGTALPTPGFQPYTIGTTQTGPIVSTGNPQ
jgi:hypothetical protein